MSNCATDSLVVVPFFITFQLSANYYDLFNNIVLKFSSDNYSIRIMDIISYFTNPASPAQRQYEALKAFYVDGDSALEASQKFNFSPSYFKKLRYEFSQTLKSNQNPFFPVKKTGPKNRFTDKTIIEEIVALRKKKSFYP